VKTKQKERCAWANGSELYQNYHDKEWGVPVHNDRKLFEFIVLETAQAGLSWITILKKREGYRKAFKNFDAQKASTMTKRDVAKLLKDASIIRNRLKIESTIANAKAFLEVQKEFGSFAKYSWDRLGGQPILNRRRTLKDLPPKTAYAEDWSRELKKRGFKFLGPTVLYAHMQAVGMVNDHLVTCFRYPKEAKRRTA